MSASQALVRQLECQRSQMMSEAERHNTDLQAAVKSRDDALCEKEQLMAELELCRKNYRQAVNFTTYTFISDARLCHTFCHQYYFYLISSITP